MPQSDVFRRYLDAGLALGQVTRTRAEEIVRELVKAGELQRNQTQQRVEELLERSRRNSEVMAEVITKELCRQLEGSPLVRREDLERLERRVNELANQLNRATEGTVRAAGALRERLQEAMTTPGERRRVPAKKAPAKKAPAEKAPAKKAPAKKAPAKKAPADKAPAEKAPADKAPAEKAPAEKAPAEKGAAKKAPAKKAPADKVAPPQDTVDQAPVAEAPEPTAPPPGGSIPPATPELPSP